LSDELRVAKEKCRKALSFCDVVFHYANSSTIIILMLDWKGPLTVGGILIAWRELRAYIPNTLKTINPSSSSIYQALKVLTLSASPVVKRRVNTHPIIYEITEISTESFVANYLEMLKLLKEVENRA
jgi:hypothetical protein